MLANYPLLLSPRRAVYITIAPPTTAAIPMRAAFWVIMGRPALLVGVADSVCVEADSVEAEPVGAAVVVVVPASAVEGTEETVLLAAGEASSLSVPAVMVTATMTSSKPVLTLLVVDCSDVVPSYDCETDTVHVPKPSSKFILHLESWMLYHTR